MIYLVILAAILMLSVIYDSDDYWAVYRFYHRYKYHTYPWYIAKGLKKLCKWFPIIYNDEDWDYNYMYIMLNKKLTTMLERFESDQMMWCPEDAAPYVKKLKIAKLLSERIVKDDYFIIDPKVFRGKEIKGMFSDKDSFFVPRPIKGSEWGMTYIPYEDYMKQQDIKMLHAILAKYSVYWWD